MTYLEPLYLNEKMVLNAAAYLFNGVSEESQEVNSISTKTDANAKIGISFLNGLLGKADLGVSGESAREEEVRTIKRYTLGGLHMSVIDELTKRNDLHEEANEKSSGVYVKSNAILQPVDIYQLTESLQTAAPLIIQILKGFGKNFGIQPKKLDEYLKYEKPIVQLLDAIEQDYLKSKQLEMVMHDPVTGRPFGIVDIDVTDYDPKEIKAKLTDGSFVIIGKMTKFVKEDQELSLVQRSVLSYVMRVVSQLVDVTNDNDSLAEYKSGIATAKPFVEKFCKLSINGPAYRLVAMSVCV